jgi:hypothetical protein
VDFSVQGAKPPYDHHCDGDSREGDVEGAKAAMQQPDAGKSEMIGQHDSTAPYVPLRCQIM